MLMPIGASWGRCEEPYRGYFRPLESHRATLSRWGTLGVVGAAGEPSETSLGR